MPGCQVVGNERLASRIARCFNIKCIQASMHRAGGHEELFASYIAASADEGSRQLLAVQSGNRDKAVAQIGQVHGLSEHLDSHLDSALGDDAHLVAVSELHVLGFCGRGVRRKQ